ncbi:MAG: DUF4440 domain-containing protein [Proteobacteria bacterium]|nr:DUF4440 domain-containing protein [Pseudomonadota bacterium]
MTISKQSSKERDEIINAMETWGRAFSMNDTKVIQSLYAVDAVFWGTVSSVRREDPAAVKDYFDHLNNFSERKVSFNDYRIRIFGEIALNTGSYTFSWVDNEQAKVIPARYSFSYIKRDEVWLIIDHHSSAMPES